MIKNITIFTNNGKTFKFNNVKPIPKVMQEERTLKEIDMNLTKSLNIPIEEYKDDLEIFVVHGAFYRFTYISESTGDKNFANFRMDSISGISITQERSSGTT